jgi:hypothetical protein
MAANVIDHSVDSGDGESTSKSPAILHISHHFRVEDPPLNVSLCVGHHIRQSHVLIADRQAVLGSFDKDGIFYLRVANENRYRGAVNAITRIPPGYITVDCVIWNPDMFGKFTSFANKVEVVRDTLRMYLQDLEERTHAQELEDARKERESGII